MISGLFEERLENSFDSKPGVSVGIVTYNSQDEIGLCLDSLEPYLRNSFCETVIIDNASQDGTASVLIHGVPQRSHLLITPRMSDLPRR